MLGLLPGSYGDKSWDNATMDNLMIRRLLETPDIEGILASPDEVIQAQAQKLVVDAMLNPLTALFRCETGELFQHPRRLALMLALLDEAADIVRAMVPQAALKSGDIMFADETLLGAVLRSAKLAGESKTPMLQDIEAGRPSEIDYINGYLVKQAEKLGLPGAHHQMLIALVRQFRVVGNDEIRSAFRLLNVQPTDARRVN